METEEELEEFDKHIGFICDECIRQQLDGTCEGCIVNILYENARDDVYKNMEDRKRHD